VIAALTVTFSIQAAQKADPAKVAMEAAKKKEVIDGDLNAAIKQYKEIVSKYRTQRSVAADALIRLAECYRKLGDAQARETYERVVREYSDQKVALALALAQAQLGEGLPANPNGYYQLTWVDRAGKEIERIGPVRAYRGVDLSPDGTRLAFHRHFRDGGDIWISDLKSGMEMRLTTDVTGDQDNSSPVWSPDGTRIAFSSFRNGKSGLYAKRADGIGAEELLFESAAAKPNPMSWSPDGKFVILQYTGGVNVLPLTGAREPIRIADSFARGQISPDGKWIAFESRLNGRYNVFVKPFPTGSGMWQVSTNGGVLPRWRGDGKELYFLSTFSSGLMMAAEIRATESSIQPGAPRTLFESGHPFCCNHNGAYLAYAVSADGQRFLIPRDGKSPAPSAAQLERRGVTGTWKAASVTDRWTLILRQDGTRLLGAARACASPPNYISDGAIDGSTITFKCESRPGSPLLHTIAFTGIIKGDEIEFTWESRGDTLSSGDNSIFSSSAPRRFTAKRVPDGIDPELEDWADHAR
jgi:dipeptidyl aminopeptidase/acylaminoacyl peptidase